MALARDFVVGYDGARRNVDCLTSHNLAEDPAHAAVLDELKAKLKVFQERTKAPWLLKWERE